MDKMAAEGSPQETTTIQAGDSEPCISHDNHSFLKSSTDLAEDKAVSGTAAESYLKRIYIENIKPYRNTVWSLHQNFSILSGGEYTREKSSTTKGLVDMIDKITSERQPAGVLSPYIAQNNKPAVLILEEHHEHDAVVHLGLFGWLGSEYYFRKEGTRLEYRDLKDKNIYRTQLDEERKEWQENIERIILCLLIYTCDRSVETSESFSIECHTKCIIQDECHNELREGKVDCFFKYLEVVNGEVCDRFGSRLPMYINMVKYVQRLRDQLSIAKGTFVTMACDTDMLTKMVKDFKKTAEEKQIRALLVTDKPSIRAQFTTRSEHWKIFITKCLYDQLSNTISIMPFVIKRSKDKCLSYDEHQLNAELIIMVEGKEDEQIIEALIGIFDRELQKKSEDRLKQLEFNDYDEEERLALLLMLHKSSIQILEGKGNAAKKLGSFFSLPIPYIVVLDQDAIFANCKADDIKKMTNDTNKLPFKLEEKMYDIKCGKELAPAVHLMNKMYSKVEPHYAHIPKHNDEVLNNFKNQNQNTSLVISSALEMCEKSDLGLTVHGYREILKIYGNIFTWEGGDGTSSGALGLDKGKTLTSDSVAEDITQNIQKNNKLTVRNVLLFKEFLLGRAFQHYLNFYETLLNQSDTRDYCERQTYREDSSTTTGHFSTHYVPKSPLLIPEEQMQKLFAYHHKEMDSKISEVKTEFLEQTKPSKLDTETEEESHVQEAESGDQNAHLLFHDIRCKGESCPHRCNRDDKNEQCKLMRA